MMYLRVLVTDYFVTRSSEPRSALPSSGTYEGTGSEEARAPIMLVPPGVDNGNVPETTGGARQPLANAAHETTSSNSTDDSSGKE